MKILRNEGKRRSSSNDTDGSRAVNRSRFDDDTIGSSNKKKSPKLPDIGLKSLDVGHINVLTENLKVSSKYSSHSKSAVTSNVLGQKIPSHLRS